MSEHLKGHGCYSCARSRSYIAETWLQFIERSKDIELIREWRVPETRYTIDGYHRETNTCYEFHGDWHHRGTDVAIDKTEKRKNELETLGYHVVEMYESDWYAEASRLGIDLESAKADVKTNGVLQGQRTHDVPDTTEYGMKLVDESFLGYKHKHTWECSLCGGSWQVALTAKKQAFAKYGSIGCPSCGKASVGAVKKVGDHLAVVSLTQTSWSDHKRMIAEMQQRRAEGRIVLFSDEVANRALVTAKLAHISKQSDAPTIYARKLALRTTDEIDVKDINAFFDANHIQGSVTRNPYAHALVDEDGVIRACMTFAPPRRGIGNVNQYGENTYELVRYATSGDVRVPGGASRLLAAFIKECAPGMIYSFADKRWSKGQMYRALGFQLESETKSDYFYVNSADPSKRFHRWGFRKDMMKRKWPETYDSSLTEHENALAHGYYRVFGLGQMKFVLRLSPIDVN